MLLLPFLSIAQCPQITLQPQSQADCEGNSIRMIVMSNGTQFQWERKRPQDANYSNISGATQANYQILPTGNTSNPNGTSYRVKISLGACSIYSDVATITLRKITSLLNPSICDRGDGSLVAQHTEGVLKIQWMRSIQGGPFTDVQDDANFVGSQEEELQIRNASTLLDGQKFKVRIDFQVSPNNDNEGSTSNQNNSPSCPRTSSEITLQIKGTPIPRHAESTYTGCENEPFNVNATGCSPYITQWYDENRNHMGTGARLSVLLTNPEPKLYFASCVNAGCESPLSVGTHAQAFSKPSPPVNAGTPAQVCPGNMITFKASGGSNNLWYLNSTSMSTISTATNYSVLASGSGTFTRYVSQKINGCESERTGINVEILPSNLCSPIDSIIDLPLPENPPPLPVDTSFIRPVATLEYRLLKNCDWASYDLQVMGCPNTLNWRINQQLIHTGNEYSIFVPENLELQIECPSTDSQPLIIWLPGLAPPTIPLQTNYEQYVCEGTKTDLSIVLPSGSNLIGWERDGHLFSQQISLHETLETGNYQAVIQRNACTYRSESIFIQVLTKPQTPILVSQHVQLCEDDTTDIRIQSSHLMYRWNKELGNQEIQFIGKSAGNYSFTAKVSDNGLCWSENSNTLSIHVKERPARPQIILAKNGGFCRGDSTRLQIDRLGMAYRWSTADTSAIIYVKHAEQYQVQWQDTNGCWSYVSPPIQTSFFPEEAQPRIQAYPNRQFCMGEQIVIKASPAFAYLWSTQASSDSISVYSSARITLKAQNSYGCWSAPSEPIEVIAQENPLMPIIQRTGIYFMQAIPMGTISKFEWKPNQTLPVANNDQIKIHQTGIYEVRAIRSYALADAPTIHCGSPYQKISIGIPLEDPGMRIYPNPNKGQRMQIEIQEDLTQIHLALHTLQGKIIKTWELADTKSINIIEMEDVISGDYLLTLITQNWARQQRIFIVSD